MLSAEELEAEYYRRFQQQRYEQELLKYLNPDRDIVLENVWVAYVWTGDQWILGGFRRRRHRRKPQTMNRFFSKVRRKLEIEKTAPVMLCDLGTALRRAVAEDQSWSTRPPQYQQRKLKVILTKPKLDRTKRKQRARQKAYIFNPKTTQYIGLGRNTWDKRKPGYLYLGPLKSGKKRQAQFEVKRLFPIWDDLLVVSTSELSKPLRAALKRNRRVRAGVTRIAWPEVPPDFNTVWSKYAKRLIRDEFYGLEIDDPILLGLRDELRTIWQAKGSPWPTTQWFHKQINQWRKECETINVARLLPPKTSGSKKNSCAKSGKKNTKPASRKNTRSSRAKQNASAKKARRNSGVKLRKRVTLKRLRIVNAIASKMRVVRAKLKRRS